VALLIGLCLAVTVEAGELMRYTDAVARSLHAPTGYIGRVLPGSAADAAEADR
jgi:multicomponent K+:H+ antiporter subunit D